jgi:DNA-binding NtrC family response regulator
MDMETKRIADQKKLRVLVVDDEPNIRDVLIQLLANDGHETLGADSGISALTVIPDFRPQIVFLDIRMPEMDGIQCLRRIKEYDPGIEVVMISGFATIDMARRSLEIGAFDYIGKPLSFDHISEVIRHIVITKFVEFM